MKKHILCGKIIFASLIVMVLVCRSYAQITTSNVSGTYTTEWGKMVLMQEGNLVTGYYEHDNGILSGMLNGMVITGSWKEEPTKEPPLDAGLLEFVFENDLKSFTGYWKYGADENNDWSGSCRK